MSQRECAGFNWPRFSVGAGEPFTSPPISFSPLRLPLREVWPPSIAFGVGQLASPIGRASFAFITVPSGILPLPKTMFVMQVWLALQSPAWPCPASLLIGVGQLAIAAKLASVFSDVPPLRALLSP
jgi:hypothetical protein